MKLLFIILAHNEPENVASFAQVLVEAGTDARTIIHFDGNARVSDLTKLQELCSGQERISFVERRVRCRWGDYSLVEAVLVALRQVREQNLDYDYAILLSGSCLPCRPIAQLERFFEENRGQEFIEAEGPEWMIGGLREERYRYWFPFPPHPNGGKAIGRLINLQKKLGVYRQPPLDGMDVKFGSQWWALSSGSCEKILNLLDREPKVERFFRRTYIPDEMMFPTLVNYIVPKENIAGFGLTHFQFTDWGKPIVFYDDHQEYPFSLPKFFYRKVSSEALQLRDQSMRIAAMTDDQSDLSYIGEDTLDYAIKTQTQTEFPRPGQIFYRDQFLDQNESILKCLKTPYIIVIGRTHEDVASFTKGFGSPDFRVLGHCFAMEEVDFGSEGRSFHGLSEQDAAIRDLHPALYLCRIRERSNAVPIISWSYGDASWLIDHARWDENALLVSLLPSSDDEPLFRVRDQESVYSESCKRLESLGLEVNRTSRTRVVKDFQWVPDEYFSIKANSHWGRMVRVPAIIDRESCWLISQRNSTARHDMNASVFNKFSWFAGFEARVEDYVNASVQPVEEGRK